MKEEEERDLIDLGSEHRDLRVGFGKRVWNRRGQLKVIVVEELVLRCNRDSESEFIGSLDDTRRVTVMKASLGGDEQGHRHGDSFREEESNPSSLSQNVRTEEFEVNDTDKPQLTSHTDSSPSPDSLHSYITFTAKSGPLIQNTGKRDAANSPTLRPEAGRAVALARSTRHSEDVSPSSDLYHVPANKSQPPLNSTIRVRPAVHSRPHDQDGERSEPLIRGTIRVTVPHTHDLEDKVPSDPGGTYSRPKRVTQRPSWLKDFIQ
ncbi:heme uptake protein IsdC [Sesbania bispinosa]|nr:heme uptake protein IsdC [Sesbania bispinosa]